MLRRRRRNLLVLGVLALVALLAVGLDQLAGGGNPSSKSGLDNQAAAADTSAAVVGSPAASASTSPSTSPSPAASASPSQSPSHTGNALVAPAADVARCPATIIACVDLERHLTWIQRSGEVVYGPVSMLPGSKQSPTPTGTFDVQWKDKNHVSGEFGDAMPYSVFFAPGGIAFHQGSQTTSSHGCIHLRRSDAAHYFAALGLRASVRVF